MATKIYKEDVFHLLIGRTPQNLNRFLSHNLKNSGIPMTKEQWSVMAVLWETDGCTQQILADATHRGRAGITRLLDNLEKEGYVKRQPDPNDRRSNLIFLTEKGSAIQQQVVSVLNEIVRAITRNILDEDIRHLRETLSQINSNILELELDLIS